MYRPFPLIVFIVCSTGTYDVLRWTYNIYTVCFSLQCVRVCSLGPDPLPVATACSEV